MKNLILICLIITAGYAFADVAAPVVTNCAKDANGDTLEVVDDTSPGPLGGLTYYLEHKDGTARSGYLKKTITVAASPVVLEGAQNEIRVEVPSEQVTDLPKSQVRIRYQVDTKSAVDVVCDKGVGFNWLFE